MKRKIGILVAVSFAIGLIVGLITPKEKTTTKQILVGCEEKYSFINKSFGCESSKIIGKQEYIELTNSLNKYIDEEEKSKHASLIALYFRDLNQGPTFGINSGEVFVPASLVKLPLLVTYLNLADSNPNLLNREAKYSKVNGLVAQDLKGITPLEPNKPYKIRELLRRMIVYSDNLAYGLLVKDLEYSYPGQDPYSQTMKELGLVDPRNVAENTFTVKSYSSLFRQLYNASYLSSDKSEEALSMLSQSVYKDGIVAGVPTEMKVAHKFGDREGLPNNEKQLHDCGIVYYPDNPYLLCIMTRGTNDQYLTDIIRTISKSVYDEVDSRKL